MSRRSGIARPTGLSGPSATSSLINVAPTQQIISGSSGLRPPNQQFRLGTSGLGQPTPQVRPGTSGLRQPISQIRPGTSGLRQPTPQVRPGTSGLRQPTPQVRPGTLGLRQPTPQVRPGTSGLRQPTPQVRSGTSGLRQPTSQVGPGTSRLRQPTPQVRPGPSGLRQPTQSFLRPPSTGQRGLSVPPELDISMIPKTEMNVGGPARDTSIFAQGVSTTKPSSRVEKLVKASLLNESSLQPGKKVTAKAKTTYQEPQKTTVTPAGREPILQRTVLEKRVERDQEGETITKNVTISNLNEYNQIMENVEMGMQEFDPKFTTVDGEEVVGTTSTVSITPEYTTVTKDYIRSVTEPIETDKGISPEELAKLIEEEKEDINNTLRMIPPDLILEPGKYQMKHRLQQMRLNMESVALLEQSVIRPEVTADEAQEELSPEDVASVMYTVETGIKPESSPEQVFNSLFQEAPNENFINLSSVAPGPLQDVVVPTEVPKDIHKESVNTEMAKLADRMVNTSAEEIPVADIFSRVMEEAQKNPETGKNNPRTFPLIQDERSLWLNANLEYLVNIVGAEPIDVLDPFNLDQLEKSDNLENELMNGVEYFVETNPIQYVNRVQLRGSQKPSYFPGYMVAAPDIPDLIKIAKNPDEVFAIAWKSVQPKYLEEESMSFIA